MGGNLRSLQLVPCWHHGASFAPRWGNKKSLVVPPDGRCSRRARSLSEWLGAYPSSRVSRPRHSLGVPLLLRVSQTALLARKTLSVAPALATRERVDHAADSSITAIPSEEAPRAVRGFAASKGSALRSASASSDALTVVPGTGAESLRRSDIRDGLATTLFFTAPSGRPAVPATTRR